MVLGSLRGCAPDAPVRRENACSEAGVGGRFVLQCDLRGGAHGCGLDRFASRDPGAEELEIGLREGDLGGLACGGVVWEAAIDAGGNWKLSRHVGKTVDVVGMNVRGEEEVQAWSGRVGANVAGDPLSRRTRAAGMCRGERAGRGIRHGARVNQHRGAVRKDQQRGVAAAGIDVVNVELALAPGGQGAVELCRCRRGAGRRNADAGKRFEERAAIELAADGHQAAGTVERVCFRGEAKGPTERWSA